MYNYEPTKGMVILITYDRMIWPIFLNNDQQRSRKFIILTTNKMK